MCKSQEFWWGWCDTNKHQQTVLKISHKQQTQGSERETYQSIRKGSVVPAMVQAKGMTSIIAGNVSMKLKI